MQKRAFVFELVPDRYINGNFRIPEHPEGKPAIIFCHGFKGFMDWGGWQYAMDKFCSNGFFIISFNFSHNGIGPDLQNFSELNKFASNTIGKELEDIAFLLKAVNNGNEFEEITRKPKIGLIGHSRGGATTILYASQNSTIECLATWASVSNFDTYLDNRIEWRSQGYIESENARTKQTMRMNVDFLNDLERNPLERNILKAEARHGLPHLIVHGYKDEAVPYEAAQEIFEASSKSITRLEILPEGTHTFGTSHPFSGSNPVFESVIDKTVEWFRMYLTD